MPGRSSSGRVVFAFDSADVHRIVDTLAARYGRWSQVVERDFVTKTEKHFPSTIWLWHLPDVEIRVEHLKDSARVFFDI